MYKTQRALATFVKLTRAADSLSVAAHTHLAKHKLSASQFRVLEALFHKGPMCQRELAEKLLKSGGNITTVVDNLEKRGLVGRERGTEDRRYITVSLTEEGNALIREVFPEHAAIITELLSALDEHEQQVLGELARKLGRTLKDG